MTQEQVQTLKEKIIAVGQLLWEKDLASGLNGNISARVDQETILITARGSCLGLLQDKDIILMKLDGTVMGEAQVSSERLLHTSIYQSLPETKAVVHTHTTYTNAFFLANAMLTPQIFETKVYLGEVKGIEQFTPAVTDVKPVIESLKNNNIVALRRHGVVAIGKEHFDCFLLIQALEDACKIDALSRLYVNADIRGLNQRESALDQRPSALPKTYKLFSQEQIEEIVRLVNQDKQMKELGEKTNMTMDLAVHLDETGQTYSFEFQKGRIANVGQDQSAEFFINASEKVWRAVFNREIDPFVATTQKKMNLRGDFAKISRWYAPCSRLFEIWQHVPID